MSTNENTYAVIVAGGQGTRMGTALPKQFLDLDGKPVLYHSIKAFADAMPGIHLILVLPAHQISYAQMILQAFEQRIDLTIVAGGETRFHSVQNGLNAISGEGIVFIHDGVRPLVSAALIHRCYEMALEKGSAIPVTPAIDSMRMIKGTDSEPVDRTQLRIVQTPQTFRTDVIKPAFEQSYNAAFTDEASVLEASGKKVYLVEGDRSNLKITTPEDLLIAEVLIKSMF
ncbi:2-C-methyl-D-erythritol 4-phosphate cytidylyltransferase [Taibaiella soli]|uniref:2-C-methyl-D-erythritol 4-phosphate cytidylyltransferase n=1 Tax=Taibaiella soli TaxID=1649169 RepID=A0A2W2ADN7_9BACT|nr:2-C-methyl-D-erythritol 4-phosphate cytidylyltransferase [Taibaiella soli]PZF71712.1 2-C-methyl-D-erythritol 4-phosphate cytidylyltransferase [Taibaiella soli]